jgi:predicted PurR-regulated permease PerM
VVVGLLAVVAGTWPALVPFLVGGVIAYGVLPLVDRLDRVLPRSIAALFSVLAVVAGLVAIVAIVIPPLVAGVVRLAADLPSDQQVDRVVADLEAWLGSRPEGGSVVGPAFVVLVGTARDALAAASASLDDVVIGVAQALASALVALIGLVVLPTWILTMLTDQRRGRRAIDRRLAPWLREDFWAIVRIVDRAGSTYLRGYLVVGLVVGLFTFLGIRLLEAAGGPVFGQPLPLAVFAGAMQLIPEIGPFIGLLPALLVAPIAPERAVAYVGIYLVARWLGSSLVGRRLLEGRLGVHPVILVPAIVALTQLGWIWLFIAAPIVSVVVNTVRYLHGRWSEPPRPAGVLPGEPVPAAASAAAPAATRVPSVYRSATATR